MEPGLESGGESRFASIKCRGMGVLSRPIAETLHAPTTLQIPSAFRVKS